MCKTVQRKSSTLKLYIAKIKPASGCLPDAGFIIFINPNLPVSLYTINTAEHRGNRVKGYSQKELLKNKIKLPSAELLQKISD